MTDLEICKALDQWEKVKSEAKDPQTDIDRLGLHYEGAMIWAGKKQTLRKLLAGILFPISFILSRHNKIQGKKNDKDAIITCSNENFLLNTDDLPNALKNEYSSYERLVQENNILKVIGSLSLDDYGLRFIKEIKKQYPHKPLLLMSSLIHLARIHAMIVDYNPKAIITTQTEQDFCSAIVTHYCEHYGVKYIAIQHGEYCYNPSMAYMRFSEYYAWNQETIDILQLVNKKIDYAYCYTPKKFQKKYRKNKDISYYIKYYLSSSDDIEQVKKIRNALKIFTEKDLPCAVRCHPRGLNSDVLSSCFAGTNVSIEGSSDLTIGESISDCKYIVAYRSTVLSEAVANSMPIVVDDITHDIDILRRVHDINLKRANLLLSELIKTIIDSR